MGVIFVCDYCIFYGVDGVEFVVVFLMFDL